MDRRSFLKSALAAFASGTALERLLDAPEIDAPPVSDGWQELAVVDGPARIIRMSIGPGSSCLKIPFELRRPDWIIVCGTLHGQSWFTWDAPIGGELVVRPGQTVKLVAQIPPGSYILGNVTDIEQQRVIIGRQSIPLYV